MNSTLDPEEERRIRAEARSTVNANAGFRWHLLVYVLVSVLLAIINAMTTPDLLWSLFPIAGWGVGVLLHRFALSGRQGREQQVEAEVQRRLAQRQAGG